MNFSTSDSTHEKYKKEKLFHNGKRNSFFSSQWVPEIITFGRVNLVVSPAARPTLGVQFIKEVVGSKRLRAVLVIHLGLFFNFPHAARRRFVLSTLLLITRKHSKCTEARGWLLLNHDKLHSALSFRCSRGKLHYRNLNISYHTNVTCK